MIQELLTTPNGDFALLADLLTRHHDELKAFLLEWSLQQERLIKKERIYSRQSSEDRSSAKDNVVEKHQSYTEVVAEKRTSSERFAEWPSSNKQPTAEEGLSIEQLVESSEDSGELNMISSHRSIRTNIQSAVFDDYEGHSVFHMSRLHARWLTEKHTQTKKWEARKNGFLARLIQSAAFEPVGMAVILVNSVIMALSVDHSMQVRSLSRDSSFQVMEQILSSYYACELILRLAAERLYFFFAPHVEWNMLDLFLVCFSLQEVVMEFFEPNTKGGGNLSFFRILRIGKMLKMLRILRILRSFRELRLILASMLGSMRTMLWSVVLIILITFIIALFFMNNISAYIAEQAGDLEPQFVVSIDKYWSSMRTAMMSLYMSSTGGEDWGVIAEPLKAVGEPFHLFFMIYIAFFMFVIVNTMTSIFIEAAMVNAEKDHKHIIKEEMKKKHEYIALIKRLFAEVDKDGKGQITRDDFIAQLSRSQMIAFLSHVGIDALDAEGFFDILASESDFSDKGIDVEEFVMGCMKLRGAARSIDLLGLIHKQDTCYSRLQKSVSGCQNTVNALQKQLSDLTQASEAHERVDMFVGKAKTEVETNLDIDLFCHEC